MATATAPRKSGLEAEQVLGKAYDVRLIKRIAKYVRPHRALLLVAVTDLRCVLIHHAHTRRPIRSLLPVPPQCRQFRHVRWRPRSA